MEGLSTPKKSASNNEVKLTIGAIFSNPEEIWDCYLEHARAKGFPAKKRTSKKNTIGIIRSITYCCACAGFPKPANKNPIKTGKSMKCGCPAKVTARLVTISNVWEITSFVQEHNHFASPSQNRFYACNRQITAHQKQQICVMDEAGIKTSKIYGVLVQGAGGDHEDMNCSQKDCRNFVEEVRRNRLGEGDAPAVMEYFAKMVSEDPNFYFDVELDEDKHLKNVFWCHGRKLNYVIRETEFIEGFKKMTNFDVCFEGNREDYEFLCSCRMFQSKGIVCAHVVYVLCRISIDRLPETYILKRWRKDVRRSHTKMKLQFSTWKNSTPQRRYRDMCTKFSEIADRVATNDEEYNAMNHWLVETMNSLNITDNLSTDSFAADQEEEENEEEDENNEDDDTEEEEEEDAEVCIKDPKRRKRKGRPRKLRMKAHRKKTAAEKLQAIEESSAPNQNATEDMIKQWGVYGQILNSQIRKTQLQKKRNGKCK